MKRRIHVVDTLRMITYDRDYADIAREYKIVGTGARAILEELDERSWRSERAIAEYLEREFGYKFSWSPGRGWRVEKYGSRRKKHEKSENACCTRC